MIWNLNTFLKRRSTHGAVSVSLKAVLQCSRSEQYTSLVCVCSEQWAALLSSSYNRKVKGKSYLHIILWCDPQHSSAVPQLSVDVLTSLLLLLMFWLNQDPDSWATCRMKAKFCFLWYFTRQEAYVTIEAEMTDLDAWGLFTVLQLCLWAFWRRVAFL